MADSDSTGARAECLVVGCERPKHTRGMCGMHYQRFWKTGEHGAAESRVQQGAVCRAPSGCDKPAHAKGLCGMHYCRLLQHGDLEPKGRHPYGGGKRFLDQLLASLPCGNECIEWPFGTDQSGYGFFGVGAGRQYRAHLHVLQATAGAPTAPGLEAAHACGNARCVNPNHLRWATKTENRHDRRQHGTNGRLADDQVLDIFESKEPSKVLQERHECSRRTVFDIRSGRTWAWLTGGREAG